MTSRIEKLESLHERAGDVACRTEGLTAKDARKVLCHVHEGARQAGVEMKEPPAAAVWGRLVKLALEYGATLVAAMNEEGTLEDEDGIDGPFDANLAAAMAEDKKAVDAADQKGIATALPFCALCAYVFLGGEGDRACPRCGETERSEKPPRKRAETDPLTWELIAVAKTPQGLSVPGEAKARGLSYNRVEGVLVGMAKRGRHRFVKVKGIDGSRKARLFVEGSQPAVSPGLTVDPWPNWKGFEVTG